MSNLVFTVGVDTKSATESVNTFFNTFGQAAQNADSKLKDIFGKPIKKQIELVFENGQFISKELDTAAKEARKVELAAKAIKNEFAKTPKEVKLQLSLLRQARETTKKFGADGKTVTEDWKKLTAAIAKGQEELRKLTTTAGELKNKKPAQNMTAQFLKANLAAKAVEGTFKFLVGSVQNLVSTAAEMEVLDIQLQAFTGGADQARAALAEFAAIAAGTPFNLQQIANAGKIMMAFGVETNIAKKATKDLAVVATATGGDLNNLARNLGQIAAQGQAYTRDLTQFAIQGIPIWDEMSKITGKNVNELKKLATEGAISFELVNGALKSLAADGGAYAEIVKNYQNTIKGQTAQLEANFQLLSKTALDTAKKIAQAFGVDLLAPFKLLNAAIKEVAENLPGMIAKAIEMFQRFSPVIATVVAGLIAMFGPQVVAAFAGVIAKIVLITAKTFALIVAQTKLLLLMGPKGYAIIAIAAGAAALAIGKTAKTLQGAKEAARKFQKEMDEARKRAEALANGADGAADSSQNLMDTFNKGDRLDASIEKAGKALKKMGEDAKVVARETKLAKEEVQDKARVAVRALEDEKQAIKEAGQADKERYQEAKREIKAKRDTAIRAIEEEKSAAQKAHNAVMSNLDAQAAKVKAELASLSRSYDAAMSRAQASADAASARMDKRIARAEAAANAAQARQERKQQEEKAAHDAEISRLRRIEVEAKKSYDAEVRRLDELRSLEERRHDAYLRDLEERKSAAEGLYENAQRELESLLAKEEELFNQSIALLEEQARKAEETANAKISAIDEEIQAQRDLTSEVRNLIETRYDGEIEKLDQRRNALERQYEEEKSQIQSVIDDIESRYDNELRRIDEIQAASGAAYDAEIAALRELTPAEERLKQLKKEKLIQQANNLALSEEERLSAQAQLDDMERQKAIAEVRARQQEAEAGFEAQKQAILAQQTEALKVQEQLLAQRASFYEEELLAIEAATEAAEAAKQSEIAAEENRYQQRITNLENEREALAAGLEFELARIETVETAQTNSFNRRRTEIEAEIEANRAKYDNFISEIDRQADVEERRHEKAIALIEAEAEAYGSLYEKAQSEINVLKEAERARHEARMNELDIEEQRVNRYYDNLSDRLQQLKSDEEQKAKARLGQIEEEKRNAEFLKQQELNRIEEQKKKEEEKHKDRMEDLDEEKDKTKDKFDKEAEAMDIVEQLRIKQEKARVSRIDAQLKDIKRRTDDEIREIERGYDQWKYYNDLQMEALKKKIDRMKDVKDASEKGTNQIKSQATATGQLAGKAQQAAAALTAQAKAQLQLNAANNGAKTGSNPPARASGGPVSGGSRYTVNELGKEAFLSASGKLSMIKAPSYGTWTAPSSGTVIPAHLTSQLDIPATGINIKNINTSPSGMVSAISNARSNVRQGDNISNSVTIQSAQPRQTASDVMVQLAKLKRVRYS